MSTVLDGKSQSPVMEKEVKPEISGVVISADGGGSAVIRAEISEAMEALLGLPANKSRCEAGGEIKAVDCRVSAKMSSVFYRGGNYSGIFQAWNHRMEV